MENKKSKSYFVYHFPFSVSRFLAQVSSFRQKPRKLFSFAEKSTIAVARLRISLISLRKCSAAALHTNKSGIKQSGTPIKIKTENACRN
jgi:hypothetical protein